MDNIKLWLERSIVALGLLLFLIFLTIEPIYTNGEISYRFRSRNPVKFVTITKQTLPGLLAALIIIFSISFCLAYYKQIWNLITVCRQKFTDDTALIEFTTKINSNFKNQYSICYYKNNLILSDKLSQIEIPEFKYRDILSKAELIEQVSNLFFQYQRDRTVKDFPSMIKYIAEPFYLQQKHILNNKYVLVYDCNLSDIIPVDLEFIEERFFFLLYINGKITEF